MCLHCSTLHRRVARVHPWRCASNPRQAPRPALGPTPRQLLMVVPVAPHAGAAFGAVFPAGDKTVVFNGLEHRFVPTERLSSM